MLSLLTGALGAIVVIALLCGGFAAGWCAREKLKDFTPEKVDGPDETELRRLRAEHEAFQDLMNFNIDKAYGPPPINTEDGDTLGRH